MSVLLKTGEVALRKGCSKKAVIRGCEQGRLNHEYDVVTNEYEVYDDEKLAAWQPPGQEGKSPGSN
ncbi:MAG: hypothetical protein ACOY94_23295 [Bacillota bacterium]